jgi:hypothetical protein
LAEKSGNLAQLVLQLLPTWRAVLVSGNHVDAAALADRLLDLAEREGSPTSRAIAHTAQLMVRLFSGDLVGVEEHFERWKGFLGAADFRRALGAAPVTMSYAALGAWIMGHAGSARERIGQAIDFARDNKSAFEMALGRFVEGWLYRLLREPRRAETAAAQALEICEEHGLLLVKNNALFVMGWARAQLGSPSEGVVLIREGLSGMAQIGAKIAITDHLTCLAEAQALEGAIAAALGTIEDALEANPEELVFRPNILIHRGQLRFKIGQSELAEADFRDAIAVAQKMRAKAYELRATMSFARLLEKQGRRDEARTMLADIYDWFTEGFDTADLIDAKALLAELGG